MLEVRDIRKKYEGRPLLRGVSFRVASGETVCLLGASGSGKSTLLRIISGLERAESGQILWQGRDLSAVPVHKRNFGLMFQDYALFPHRSVTQNVAFGLRMQGLAPAEIAQRTTEALEQVDLTGFADRRVTDLSGGEQQRVALARALAPRPRLLMLDEPLGALDKALKEELAEELRRLLHETGIPAIYVTHDQEEAFAIADRLILLHQGIVEQSGSPAEVHGAPASPWVARFLGLNNLIAGSVVSTRPLRAATPLGVFEGTWTGAGMAQPGMRIMLLLRPNGVRPSAGEVDPTAANRLSGMVTDSIFRGDGFRISVQAKDIELSFILPEGLPTGQPVTLAIAESAVQLMPYADGEPGQPGGNPGEPA